MLFLCFSFLSAFVVKILFAHPAALLMVAAAQLPFVPQQRQLPLLLPRFCHNGGAYHICRRFLWRKIRNAVARLVFAAAHCGDNVAVFANKKRDEQPVLHPA